MIVVIAMTSTSWAPAAIAEIVEDGSVKDMSIPPLSNACAPWVPPGMLVSLTSIPFFRKKPSFSATHKGATRAFTNATPMFTSVIWAQPSVHRKPMMKTTIKRPLVSPFQFLLLRVMGSSVYLAPLSKQRELNCHLVARPYTALGAIEQRKIMGDPNCVCRNGADLYTFNRDDF